MDDFLKEEKLQGTLLYPFQIYNMYDENTKIFVSHHWHNYVEIIYITSGKLFISINNENYIGLSGDIFFINEGEFHEMYVEDTNTLYYALLFPIKYLNFEMKDFVENSYLGSLYNKDSVLTNKLPKTCKTYEEICEKLKLVIHLNESQEITYQFGTKVAILNIIYLLAKDNLIKKSENNHSLSEINKLNLLKNITSYIYENYSDVIYLKTISNEFGMCPKYFCKFFKDNFGKTFIGYLKSLRIEKSMNMLIDTNLSIMDIAFANGFENVSYYIRTFKELANCTPSSYRKQKHCAVMKLSL